MWHHYSNSKFLILDVNAKNWHPTTQVFATAPPAELKSCCFGMLERSHYLQFHSVFSSALPLLESRCMQMFPPLVYCIRSNNAVSSQPSTCQLSLKLYLIRTLTTN